VSIKYPDLPPAKAREWVAESVGPNAQVIRVQWLPGGRWHANHVVTVRRDGAADQDLVLRRWVRPQWKVEDPDFTPQREAQVLQLVGRAAVATPRLISVDVDGTGCDVPAILTDRLPGHPPRLASDADSFVRQLAEALAVIHTLDGEAREQLPAYRRYHDDLVSMVPPAWSSKPDLWTRAAGLAADPPPPGAESLIHRDYHPGNTLWLGARLTGVVDWTQGSWGPSAVDAAHMRWNLAVRYGLGAANRFLDWYRRSTPTSAPEQRYWNVITVLDLLPDLEPEEWSPVGLDRLERYLEATLDAAD